MGSISVTSSSRIEPPLAQFEAAGAVGIGAGERAALVAEQFAFGELGGEHRAVEADEWAGSAAAQRVNRLGDELLAGAALAADQHCFVGGGDLGDAALAARCIARLLPIMIGLAGFGGGCGARGAFRRQTRRPAASVADDRRLG